ncbi:MAG: glycosyltransferase family 4 protein [Actinomycetota bacterium]
MSAAPPGADGMLRVGMICPYSLTIPGGVQMQVLGLARQLRRRGHEVRVLGPCDGPPPEPFVTPLGNSLPTTANGSVAPIAPDPPATLRTIRAIDHEGFDLLHLHEPLAPGPTLTAAMLHRLPTVGTFHAAGKSASYASMRWALARLINRIDVKVVVSKDAQKLVHGYLGGEFTMLFNGIEVAQIRGTEPYERHPDREAGGPPVVFFCGRHEERKGLRVLIEAVRRMSGAVEVWIASDGPDTAELEAATDGDDRFRWLGRISDHEKFSRLRAADVFCAPSLGGESFGVVLLEAMAAETTVVASSIDGYRNVATHDVDALLPEPGDPDSLATALERAFHDPHLTARLRSAGGDRAEDFAMTALADRYLELYRQVVSSRFSRR